MTQHSRDTPQFYLTAPSPCPYLAGQEERKVFTHLVGERAPELNNILTQGGFRRSQSIAYRPACEGCRSCVSVRVIAREFRPTRSMRRIANRSADIESEMRLAVPTSEQYAIFRAYLDSRHRDGGMADMTVLDYAMMVEDSIIDTFMTEYRLSPDPLARTPPTRQPLVAAALCDRLTDGISMARWWRDVFHDSKVAGPLLVQRAEKHLERMKHLEELMELQHARGVVATSDLTRAKYLVLEAEQWLEQAKAGEAL